MDRFILRFSGPGAKPLTDVQRIRSFENVNVLDESSRMLLVEGLAQDVERLVATLQGWMLSKEQIFPLPDPKQKIRKPVN